MIHEKTRAAVKPPASIAAQAMPATACAAARRASEGAAAPATAATPATSARTVRGRLESGGMSSATHHGVPSGFAPWPRSSPPTSTIWLVSPHAINQRDDGKLCEELGDVLLQVVLHAQLANEEGRFDIQDVVSQQCEKLVRRHPHVFGDLRVADSAEVLRNWERIKAEENNHTVSESVMDGVISSLPALAFALEVSKRAVKVGFEWPDLQGVLEKFREEQEELAEAIAHGDRERIEAEVGDLLFTLVNIARHLKVDAEQALHAMVRRFIRRFEQMEELARAHGRRLEELSLEEWDKLWEQAKRNATGAG